MKGEGDKPHFHVTAGLVWNNGKVLITRRPEGSHLSGYWEFPGGKQENGETLEACLEREIEEELGMKIEAGSPLLTVDHEYETRTVSLHFFVCHWLSGKPRALQGQEMKWVEPHQLPHFRFPPPDRKLIEMLSSTKKPWRPLGVQQKNR